LPSWAPNQTTSPAEAKSPNIPTSIANGTPVGQGCALTYGPPSAQAPPTSMTARIPRYRRVIAAVPTPIPAR
jgi:hypothetical protein